MALKKLDQQTRKFVVWMALLLGAVALAVIVRAKKSDRILYEKHMDDWAYTVDEYAYRHKVPGSGSGGLLGVPGAGN